jgi:hypothetical protein
VPCKIRLFGSTSGVFIGEINYGGEGGIDTPIGEWEVRVGERWYVSCYQCQFSI